MKEGEGGNFEGIPNEYVENKDRHEGRGYRDKRRIVQLVEMRMLNNGEFGATAQTNGETVNTPALTSVTSQVKNQVAGHVSSSRLAAGGPASESVSAPFTGLACASALPSLSQRDNQHVGSHLS